MRTNLLWLAFRSITAGKASLTPQLPMSLCLGTAFAILASPALQAAEKQYESPQTYCIYYDATEKRFHNNCSADLDLHVKDEDGWSLSFIRANDWYSYHGNSKYGPTIFVACKRGLSLDNTSGSCYSYKY